MYRIYTSYHQKMEKISVENFRSITKCDMVDLKPITALVGKNSVGKSSFIRLFPLIKQSLERRISDSLLWYGDYVDFGDYNQVLSHKSHNNSMKLAFCIKIPKRSDFIRNIPVKGNNFIKVELTIKEKYFERIEIEFEDQIIAVDIDEESIATISINGDKSFFENSKIRVFRDPGYLLPELYQEVIDSSNEKFYSHQFELDKLLSKLDDYIFGKGNKGEKKVFRDRFISDYYFFEAKDKVKEIFSFFNPQKFRGIKKNNETFKKYNNIFLAIQIQGIIRRINDTINKDMKQTSYVKPIRANVDRYYRVQGVSTDELDPDGSNLPMILKNMSLKQLENFEKWSKEKFGVVFSVKDYEGHVSMIIKNDLSSSDEINVADTGYGYSQMLPIVMLLWMIHNNSVSRYNIDRTIVIEQPELHLHPALQARMMDIFVNVIRESKANGVTLKIIFETHSETMINRLGYLISEQRILKDEVNILVFDKLNDETTIQSRKFDDNGLLLGWPSDFFDSEE